MSDRPTPGHDAVEEAERKVGRVSEALHGELAKLYAKYEAERARSQGLEEALKHATFRLQEAFRFAENDQDAYAWDEIERARIALSLGLPDEEGQPGMDRSEPPPPRGAAHQGRDVDDLRADVQRSVGADGQGARTSHPAPEPSLGKRALAAAIRGSRDRQEELAVMDFFSALAPRSAAPRARSAINESPSVRDVTGEGER